MNSSQKLFLGNVLYVARITFSLMYYQSTVLLVFSFNLYLLRYINQCLNTRDK